ncbi:DUF3574 domain-containing protein [Gluconobacter sphaericus]|uniref:Lipoprotein n=1 Tax=Gluconobacter sphaericus NBRC 12467 TaxID=1307951 RepID=A0AA37WB67_9PROT|nr:DUF3574 domain-containing protein [Gluconobacter sphaericus]MBF0885250.1 DUF3574 domain-containing protein [Gluconobacter sphaericus]MBS1085051.1 DUF3574 domain-containing protein [Gluconobacter sphaericus]MBS1096101.1 DUF3574 domain-containing protein [Gluconobacter sphaericus]MBS1098731.1 DUF3574 domain-containing protein [Gluconobacter sphaericus]QQX91179.1 DUF3574 domain-containing protein [Gluconobacter sphaericus]
MKKTLLLLSLTAPLLGGCIVPVSVTPNLCREIQTRNSVQIRLMFGLTRPDGSIIDGDDWQNFVNSEITPRFPAGFTVIDAQGQWYDAVAHRVTREASRIVWIVAPSSDRNLQPYLKSIRQAYQKRFSQQAVGLAIQSGCSSFENMLVE